MLYEIIMYSRIYLKIKEKIKATVKKIEKESLKNLAYIMNLRS